MSTKPSDGVYVISDLKPLNNSVNGNPRWLVTFKDGTEAITQSDVSCSYGLNNPDMRGVPLNVRFSRAGRITHARKVS